MTTDITQSTYWDTHCNNGSTYWDLGQRVAYCDLVEDLLKPDETYIALAFPIVERAAGPPFAVAPTKMIAALERRGFDLLRRERPLRSIPARRGVKELLVLRRADPRSLDRGSTII
jgi:hypothetical protein